jgi:hypothetical protein
MSRIIPDAWMPNARMQRIIVHWTAGQHQPSAYDRSHYHVLIDGNGRLVRGGAVIGGPVAHTLNCNTGSIGVSLACMGGAVEVPFSSGKWPMTPAQWDVLPIVLADLCDRYGIPVGPKTVLSHAEVQPNLGIMQRGKWDIARISFMPEVRGARACGDLFRKATTAVLEHVPHQVARFAGEAIDEHDGGEPEEQPDVPAPLSGGVAAAVQRRLRELGYYEVGKPDGDIGNRTEAAILAFRNDNGLPFSTGIDDEFLAALAKAEPRRVAQERAGATAEDLRKSGSETIAFTDRAKVWFGRVFGVGAAAAAVDGGSSTLDTITNGATRISGLREALGGLGIGLGTFVLVALIALGCWYVVHRLEQRRVADYRAGKNP